MKWFHVYVEDHITHQKVTILDLATREEAHEISSFIGQYNGCTVFVVESDIIWKKGKHE